jgi:DNA-directed RNA polymerase subunit alpha
VEQRTDYEKLLMEVATDGTIHPEEAVKQASRILIQHLMIITDENITFDNKEEKKEDIVDEQTLQLRKVLKTPLEDLDLSVRAFNCLKAGKDQLAERAGAVRAGRPDEVPQLRPEVAFRNRAGAE